MFGLKNPLPMTSSDSPPNEQPLVAPHCRAAGRGLDWASDSAFSRPSHSVFFVIGLLRDELRTRTR